MKKVIRKFSASHGTEQITINNKERFGEILWQYWDSRGTQATFDTFKQAERFMRKRFKGDSILCGDTKEIIESPKAEKRF